MIKERIDYENLDIATPRQRESIAELEQLNLGAQQIAEIILVLLDLKPATELLIFKHNDTPSHVQQVIEQTGLKVLPKPHEHKRNRQMTGILLVSKNRDYNLELLFNDGQIDQPIAKQRRYGQLMGYPNTAIDAYCVGGQELLPDQEEPNMAGIPFSMKLSRKGKDQELKLLQYWSKIIRKYAPTVYERALPTDEQDKIDF